MNVGELFVNLGVKGSEKTVGALTNVQKGLSETASVSLEAKAGILAAMYALERLFAASGAVGTGLTNFNALTGLSTQQLQQWQYAARQAGISGEEMTGSVKSVQTAMTNMLLGKGAPEGLAMLANKVGFDPRKARDTFYVLEQLQKFARTVPNDIGNSVIKSFGVSDGTIAAMRRNAFRPEVLAKAPTYNQNEIGALDRANVAWSNLGAKIEMAVGKFNAKHGGQLVQDIAMITDSVMKLAEALEQVSSKFKIFEKIGQGLEGVANTLKLVSEISDKVNGKESKKGDLLYREPGAETFPGFAGSPMGKFFQALMGNGADTEAAPRPGQPGSGTDAKGKPLVLPWGEKPVTSSAPVMLGRGGKSSTGKAPAPLVVRAVPSMKNAITPKAPYMQPKVAGATQTISVSQNLHFQHDRKDHKQTSDSVKKATQEAYRQFPQGQVN